MVGKKVIEHTSQKNKKHGDITSVYPSGNKSGEFDESLPPDALDRSEL